MDDRDRGFVVEVVHPHGDLLRPEQDLIKVDAVPSQVVIEGTKFSILYKSTVKVLITAPKKN